MSKKLYDKLDEYSQDDYYPFHMPGHKRNYNLEDKSPYLYDITEIDGFDNLHEPEEIIKIRMDKAKEHYGSGKSYFLVNGSTCGILSAISAICDNGKDLIMARNSHKAAYNGVFLMGVKAEYIYPRKIEEMGINGGIDPIDVENILKESNNIGAVYITSPTYEGVVSDIKSISKITNRYNIPLIVDEAHGAHFSQYEKFPKSAIELGGDIVIQSLHKTLPSLTQTAILHISNNFKYREKLEKYLSIYQSSSPSYVLLKSIDRCMEFLIKDNKSRFVDQIENIKIFKENCKSLSNIKVIDEEIIGKNKVFDFDISKLVIYSLSNNYKGKDLYNELLREYHIQMEMASRDYVIAMTSPMDKKEGFERLYKALKEIDGRLTITQETKETKENKVDYMVKSIVEINIKEAVKMEKETIEFEKGRGRISAEFMYLYPPGVPILVPGEKITDDIIKVYKDYKKNNLNICGLEDKKNNNINVLKERSK